MTPTAKQSSSLNHIEFGQCLDSVKQDVWKNRLGLIKIIMTFGLTLVTFFLLPFIYIPTL